MKKHFTIVAVLLLSTCGLAQQKSIIYRCLDSGGYNIKLTRFLTGDKSLLVEVSQGGSPVETDWVSGYEGLKAEPYPHYSWRHKAGMTTTKNPTSVPGMLATLYQDGSHFSLLVDKNPSETGPWAPADPKMHGWSGDCKME